MHIELMDAWRALITALLLWVCYIITKSNPVADAALHLVVVKLETMEQSLRNDLATHEDVAALRIEVAQIREAQLKGARRNTDKLPEPSRDFNEGGTV